MKKVVVSVPGKIILMGDHAIVYGKPALLTAVDLRLFVTIETLGKGQKGITIVSSESVDYVKHAIRFLFDALKITKRSAVRISIRSDIPPGYHLGSSAAVAVGLAGAVMYYFTGLWNPMRMNELAYEIEKKQHGTPSGGDNTVVTMGGFIWFRKELEFLKSIWQLPFRPHLALNHFFLINTGRPKETTGEMVALVRERMHKDPKKMQATLDLNELQVKRVTTAMKEGREDELVDAIRIGERTLEEMGVVSANVVPCIRDIEKVGGAAKILGGGGKTDSVGFLLCYHHEPKHIAELSKKYGYTIQMITLGEEGVRLEQ